MDLDKIDAIELALKENDAVIICSNNFKKKCLFFSESGTIDEYLLISKAITNNELKDLVRLLRKHNLLDEKFDLEKKILSSYTAFNHSFQNLIEFSDIRLSDAAKNIISQIILHNKNFKDGKINQVISGISDLFAFLNSGYSSGINLLANNVSKKLDEVEFLKEIESQIFRSLEAKYNSKYKMLEDDTVYLDKNKAILIIDDYLFSYGDLHYIKQIDKKINAMNIRLENIAKCIEGFNFINISENIEHPKIVDLIEKFDSNKILKQNQENNENLERHAKNGVLFNMDANQSLDYKKNLTLSNSSIKRLIENPYFFYIEKLLNIRSFQVDDSFESPALKGKIVHKICEEFSKFCRNNKVDLISFKRISQLVLLQNYNISVEKNIFWKVYTNSIANKIIQIEKDADSMIKVEVERMIYGEIDGIKIMAIVDRIEYIDEKTVNVYDFKTSKSSIYSFNDEITGNNPQLSIIGLILSQSGITAKKMSYTCLDEAGDSEDEVFEGDKIKLMIENAKSNITYIVDFIKNSKIDDFVYMQNNLFGKFEDYIKMEHFARKRLVF